MSEVGTPQRRGTPQMGIPGSATVDGSQLLISIAYQIVNFRSLRKYICAVIN